MCCPARWSGSIPGAVGGRQGTSGHPPTPRWVPAGPADVFFISITAPLLSLPSHAADILNLLSPLPTGRLPGCSCPSCAWESGPAPHICTWRSCAEALRPCAMVQLPGRVSFLVATVSRSPTTPSSRTPLCPLPCVEWPLRPQRSSEAEGAAYSEVRPTVTL